MDNLQLLVGLALILYIFYNLQMNGKTLDTEHVSPHHDTKNATNMGFVKPEHRLLKIFNTLSAGSKIQLQGICNRFVYNKNTIDTSVNNRLTAIVKELINSINKISKNDYYIKHIENVYALISCDRNQRYFIDFFIYDVKNYYTIRLIADIVIVDNEIYINYMNVQTGANSTILNKYDIRFNDTGILFDGNMFKENIADLFDSYYRNSFKVIGVSKSSLDYSREDLTSVLSMNSLRNMYFPASVSPSSVKQLENKDLSGYLEMYLPSNQIDIKSPMFCDKYKIEWDNYGVANKNDTGDKDCYVNQSSTVNEYNRPWNPPGLLNNNRTDVTHYDWLLQKQTISNSL